MKHIFTILVAVLLTATTWAQSPEKLSYQAVVRNSSGQLIVDRVIGVKISILQGSASGTAVYVETQTRTTNDNGLVSIEIGTGTTSDDFSLINWANGLYFIKTETDPAGGTNYSITGTSQLLSVPYALHAKTAESVSGGITESDPVYSAWDKSTGISITESQVSDLQSYLTTEVDGSVTNEIQALSISNDTIYLSSGGFVKLPAAAAETDPSVPTGTQTGDMQYWNGTAWITVAAGNEGQMLIFNGGVPTWTTVIGVTILVPTDVYNPTTGKIWMDRNLGATQVATSSTDAAAYGDLYQWGRAADGHESRTSATTTTLATSDTPVNGDFITTGSTPYDWRSPQNDNLWQGVNGTNNPCPSGYRLPTEAEWEAERLSWSSYNTAGAFASPLKLPLAGNRYYSDGTLGDVGSAGCYWSGTVGGTGASGLVFYSSFANVGRFNRANGYSVRCLKD